MLQDAAQHNSNAGVRDAGTDGAGQPTAPHPRNEGAAEDAEEHASDISNGEKDMDRDGAAQAPRRRPVDPVLPNKRRSYV